jgi:hypothetical protein
MPVGLQAFQTANDVNAISGGIARDLNAVLARVQAFQVFLEGTDLTDPPYSFSDQEEAIIKSAFADLDQLRQTFEGVSGRPTRATNYDYRIFAKSLWGFGRAS